VPGEPGGNVPDAVAERVRVGFPQLLVVAEAEEAGPGGQVGGDDPAAVDLPGFRGRGLRRPMAFAVRTPPVSTTARSRWTVSITAGGGCPGRRRSRRPRQTDGIWRFEEAEAQNDRSLASWPDLDEFILGECSVTHSELRGQLPVDLSSLHGRANQVAELCVFLIHAGICPALRGLSGAYGSTAPLR
jgi:hypothetical protein